MVCSSKPAGYVAAPAAQGQAIATATVTNAVSLGKLTFRTNARQADSFRRSCAISAGRAAHGPGTARWPGRAESGGWRESRRRSGDGRARGQPGRPCGCCGGVAVELDDQVGVRPEDVDLVHRNDSFAARGACGARRTRESDSRTRIGVSCGGSAATSNSVLPRLPGLLFTVAVRALRSNSLWYSASSIALFSAWLFKTSAMSRRVLATVVRDSVLGGRLVGPEAAGPVDAYAVTAHATILRRHGHVDQRRRASPDVPQCLRSHVRKHPPSPHARTAASRWPLHRSRLCPIAYTPR